MSRNSQNPLLIKYILELEARVNPKLKTLGDSIQSQFFLWKSEIHFCIIGLRMTIPGEDLDIFVRRFHEEALDYCDVVDGETLANICMHGMSNGYRINLENLTFPSFSKLIEAARESIRRTPRSSHANCLGSIPRSFLRKTLVVAAVEDNQETRLIRPKMSSFLQGYKSDSRTSKKSYPILSPFPCGIKKATAWRAMNQDIVIILPNVDQLPLQEDWRDINYC